MKRIIYITILMLVTSWTSVNASAECNYSEYIKEIADSYEICPELIQAIIETESSGKADADNGSCKGLMQIDPRWHKARMERLGVTDLLDPKSNILVGCDYLSELFDTYEDLATVLMVYNMGNKGAELARQGKVSKYATKIAERSAELEDLNEYI